MSRRIGIVAGATLASILLLSGCTAGPDFGGTSQSPATESTAPPAATETTAPAPPPAPAEQKPAETKAPESAPVSQEETCDWDSGRLDSGSASGAPSSTGTDLETALIGSWQHTHIDSGGGFEALETTTDIRYVFPSTNRLLYCQDVQGATTQAENAVDMELNSQELVLPSPATGYTVTAWSADTMVWTNHRDGSLYLLKRR